MTRTTTTRSGQDGSRSAVVFRRADPPVGYQARRRGSPTTRVSPAVPLGLPLPDGCDAIALTRQTPAFEEYVLVTRRGGAVIVQAGHVGEEGRCARVDYPTDGEANTAYRLICAEFASQGFQDSVQSS